MNASSTKAAPVKNGLILIGHFLLAVLATFFFASIFHSQFVIAELIAIDVSVPFDVRIDMTLSDLSGLLPGYGGIIFASLLLGFLIMNAISRWLAPLPNWRYVLAGFIAIGTALVAMHPIFNITLIAGARSTTGILCQCFAGAVGGFLFMKLRANNEKGANHE